MFPFQQTLDSNLKDGCCISEWKLGANLRRPYRHWGPLQCNTRSRPQEKTPIGASIHSKRGYCSIFPTNCRKWRFRNHEKYRRTKV